MKVGSSAVLMFVMLTSVACAPAADEVVVEEPDTTAADMAAIQDLLEAWSTLFDLQNPDPYLDLFTENARFLPPDSRAIDGKAAIREWVSENFLDGSLTTSSMEREVLSEFAYDVGTFAFSPTPQEGEEPRTINGKYVLFMRRQADGSWKLTQYIWNFTPPREE